MVLYAGPVGERKTLIDSIRWLFSSMNMDMFRKTRARDAKKKHSNSVDFWPNKKSGWLRTLAILDCFSSRLCCVDAISRVRSSGFGEKDKHVLEFCNKHVLVLSSLQIFRTDRWASRRTDGDAFLANRRAKISSSLGSIYLKLSWIDQLSCWDGDKEY